MAISACCYQLRVHNLCAKSPQHGFSEILGRASPIHQGGWPGVWNARGLGASRTNHLGRPQYYYCVNARQDATSNGRFHDVNDLSPVSRSSGGRSHTRILRQCNALPALVVEGDEEEESPWEGAVMFRRNAAQSRVDYATTLERLGLSRFASEKSISMATDMGLEKSEVDGVVGTPVQISAEVTKEGRDYRVDGVIRTVLTMVCNRCLAPVAERIYASFSLLLTEAPVKEPTEPKLGVVLGEDVNIWRAEDEDVEEELDIDLDDKLHFPRDKKELDLSKYLRDTIHLEIPSKSLCDSACPGFCFGCGVNLNNSACRCGMKKKKTQYAVNTEELLGMDRKKNIWGPLEQLKKQLEEQQKDQSDDPK